MSLAKKHNKDLSKSKSEFDCKSYALRNRLARTARSLLHNELGDDILIIFGKNI